MSRRALAMTVAAAAIALVLAQDVVPRTPLYHGWQYALALVLAIAVLVAYGVDALRGRDGVAGRRLSPVAGGAIVIALAGLASGLLGPDTAQVQGTPGTVQPIPALGVAAFFPPVDAATLARGAVDVTLRRRNAPELVIAGNGKRVFGESLLYLEPHPAISVDARDGRGAHLTVTQPNNASFLSPVLLLRSQQRIGAFEIPFDTFATPGIDRVVRVLYFTAEQLRGMNHLGAGSATGPAAIVTVSDNKGRPLGITIAPSGKPVMLGGVRMTLTIGTYPALAIAAAPEPWAVGAGLVLVTAGAVWAAWRPRAQRAASPAPVSAEQSRTVI